MKKLTILLIGANLVFAYVGEITALKGDAFIIRDNHDIKAKLGMKVDNKDKIKTLNGKLQVIFKDRTIITIGKNSEFDIESFSFTKKNITEHFKLTKGIVKTITGEISKLSPDRFKLKTKNALIGIRGTIFITEFNNDTTKVSMLEGITTFTDLQTSQTFEVKAGEQIILNPKLPKRVIIKKEFTIPKLTKTNKTTKTIQNLQKNTKKITQQPQNIPTETIQEITSTTNVDNTDIENTITQNDTTQKVENIIDNYNNGDLTNNSDNNNLTDNSGTLSNDGNNLTDNSGTLSNNGDLTNNSDQSTENITMYNTNDYTLGYTTINSTPSTTWFNTTNSFTSLDNINTLINNNVTGKYSGDIVAINNHIVYTGTSNININFALQNWDGIFNIDNNRWLFDVTGIITNSAFSGVVSNTEDSSIATNIQGDVSGAFYKDDASLLLGSGALTSSDGDVNFAFSATQTSSSAQIAVISNPSYTLGYLTDNNTPTSTFYNTLLLQTTQDDIDNLINSQTYASYDGSVVALDKSTNTIYTGNVNISLDFISQIWNGKFNIADNKWHFTINDTPLNSNQFSSNDISTQSDSQMQNITGTINGNIYNNQLDKASLVAGNGDISSSDTDLELVFGADKTYYSDDVFVYTPGTYKVGYSRENGEIISSFAYSIPTDAPIADISTLASKNTIAQYAGNIVATTSTNVLQGATTLSFDFANQTWNGTFSFGDSNDNNLWLFTMDGDINNNNFTLNNISTDSNSNAQDISANNFLGYVVTTTSTDVSGNTLYATADLSSDQGDVSFAFGAERFTYEDDIVLVEDDDVGYKLGYRRKDNTPQYAIKDISATQNTTSEIDNLIASQAQYSYSGSVVAVTNNSAIEGTSSFNFDFGNQTWSGDIDFGDNPNKWHFSVSGALTDAGFADNDSFSDASDSDVTGIGGDIGGLFYKNGDTDAGLIAGDGSVSGSLNGEDVSASLTFAATKE